MNPDVDWSEFSTEPPPPAADVDWSQFSAEPPAQGPPAADFSNVRSGASAPIVPRGTMPQLQDFSPEGLALHPETSDSIVQGAKDVAGELESGVQGAAEGYQYPQELDENGQPKRRVGMAEAFGRRALSGFEDLADVASYAGPGAAEHIASKITGRPTGMESEAETTRVHPETEQYQGAREELVGNLGADLLTNFAPIERLGSLASKALKAPWLKTGAKDAALVGDLGPGPQGSAIADEIADQALDAIPKRQPGAIDVTPDMRAPAEAVDVGRGNEGVFPGKRAEPLPDAAVDASAAQATGEAFGVSPGDVPTPARSPFKIVPEDRVTMGSETPQPSDAVQPGISDADMPLSSAGLNDSQRAAETKARAQVLADPDAAKRAYRGLPGTDGGNVISVDEAREIFPDYASGPEGRSANAVAVHEPASAVAKAVWRDRLAEPVQEGKAPLVTFTGGGTGAGKTSGMERIPEIAARAKMSDIVYDGNLQSTKSAVARINEALDSGRAVNVVYTFRDPIQAFAHGVLPRAEKASYGRTVPIEGHVATHQGAAKTYFELRDHFKDNPHVDIKAIWNDYEPGKSSRVSLADDADVHAIATSDPAKMRAEVNNELETRRAQNAVSDRVYNGTLGRENPRPSGGGEGAGSVRPLPREPAEAPRPEVDAAHGDTSDVYASELGKLQDELGWQEQGGRMIRGAGGEKGFGDVTGRTKWVAKSDFWPKYRANDPNPLSEAEASRALEKMGAGEKLTKREERFGAFAKQTASERAGEYGEALAEHHEISRQDYERGARASIRDEQRAAEEEGSSHAEAVRGDEGQVRGAGAIEGKRGGRGGPDLQRPAEKAGSPFAQRVHEGGESEVPRNDAEAPGLKEPGQTGIYNAKVAEERARRGLEEVKHDLGRGDKEIWQTAQDRLAENPLAGRDLAHDIIRSKRPPTAEEVHTLVLDRQRIKNERRSAYESAELAQDAGNEEKAAAARERIRDLDEQYEINDVASRYSAHEQGLAFRARQIMAREDYSMAHMVQRAKVEKGAALSAEETKRVEAMARDVEKREAAVAAREQAVRDARAKPRSPFGVKDAGKRFDALLDELKKLGDKEQLEAGCIV